MRRFTLAPAFTLSGRKNKGLRGYAGKPFHPPLTDIPVAAYLFAAGFDVLSLLLHGSHPAVGRELYVAGTWVLLGGGAVSLLAALTGWADWARSSEPGTQVRRTINAHAVIMLTVTGLVLLNIALRLLVWPDEPSAPVLAVVLSVAAAVLVSAGAAIGGSLVYEYGFNVETAGDHPVYHRSEVDVRPGQEHQPAPPADAQLSDG